MVGSDQQMSRRLIQFGSLAGAVGGILLAVATFGDLSPAIGFAFLGLAVVLLVYGSWVRRS